MVDRVRAISKSIGIIPSGVSAPCDKNELHEKWFPFFLACTERSRTSKVRLFNFPKKKKSDGHNSFPESFAPGTPLDVR